MDVIQVAVLGLVGMMIGVLLKGFKPEYSVYVSLACGILILLAAASRITYLLKEIRTVQEGIAIDASYLDILLKMIGITYIGHFSSNLCKDTGYSSLALQIETFCKLSMMSMAMPVFLSLLEVIQEFLR